MDTPIIDWDDLRFFLALQRHGTVAGAASALRVSRSTIQRRIGQLETSAGAPLIERRVDRWALTAAGEALLPIAERMESEAVDAARLFAANEFSLSGKVVVSAFEGASSFFAPAIAELAARHPKLDLHWFTSPAMSSLREREADIALRVTERPASSLFGRRLGRLPFAVFGLPPQCEDVRAPFVVWDEAIPAADAWNSGAAKGQRSVYVDSIDDMIQLVLAGAGVAYLPEAVARRETRLVKRPGTEGAGLSVWLLTHPDLRRSARVRAVMDYLASSAREAGVFRAEER